jgi:hypothetical protein
MHAVRTGTVCISGIGMATALAAGAFDSCAAARSGITRISELTRLPNEDEAMGEEPIAGCRARYIPPGFTGLAKALLLGKAALTDLRSRRPLTPGALPRTGISINLSDQFLLDSNFEPLGNEDDRLPSVVWAEECNQLTIRLLSACQLDIRAENQRLYFGGHTGFVRAAEEAESLLSSGQLDRCIVGAIDSCIEARFLRGAAIKGLLKTSANPAGFIPGEAAAFVLLERTDDVCSDGRTPAATLMGSCLLAGKRDRFSDDPPDGIRLARAIDEALSPTLSSRHERLAMIVGDLNGDEYRARDWGSALIRLCGRHDFKNVPMWLPALAFGETGAAAGPVGLGLAIRARQRGCAPAGIIVEWLSSESGAKGALCFIS